ncbi:MAG TPA: recombinase family protein, partial [Candidatus Saccharimonadales bacterium]|nr:recombinase family protein [Candidatus Saccharimonadales bacterium]
MRIALYARVSTDIQEARGSIGSQLEALRARADGDQHEVVAEYLDDGYSGARLDRPALDRLRDGAEAGLFEAVLCLTPDRLARVYAYQVLILDELQRHGVRVLFTDALTLDDDPQARLLTQVQGVIAEYERAKIAERNRRGRLYRARAGEPVSWNAPYGYRRIARTEAAPAHLEVIEPEAAVVRRIFDDYVAGGHSMRQIALRFYDEKIPSPLGKPMWRFCTISRVLRDRAYVGTWYYNRTEVLSGPTMGRKSARSRRRPESEWIAIAVPAIVTDAVFEAAQRVSWDNSKWSPRRAEPGAHLLRGLVRCGRCGSSMSCMKTSSGQSFIRYYRCHKHDPIAAGGRDRVCQERQVRAGELDELVFERVRDTLLRPEVLLAGEAAVTSRLPSTDDDLLAAQLDHLKRKLQLAAQEHRRLLDLYQAGLVDLDELKRRVGETEARQLRLSRERDSMLAERAELGKENRLRQRLHGFAVRVRASLKDLDFDQRQRLLRLVVEEVRITGTQVE